MHGLLSRLFVAASLAIAMSAPAWWVLSLFLALAAPGAEPFPNPRDYITGWLVYSFVLTVPFAVIALCIAIPVSHPQRWRAARKLRALNWLWAVAPLHVAWCVAYLLHASYGPGFDGFINTGRLPVAWKAPLALASSSFAFLAVSLVAATFVLFRLRRAHAAAKAAPDPASVCERCGYSRTGLTSPTCPECGTSLPA